MVTGSDRCGNWPPVIAGLIRADPAGAPRSDRAGKFADLAQFIWTDVSGGMKWVSGGYGEERLSPMPVIDGERTVLIRCLDAPGATQVAEFADSRHIDLAARGESVLAYAFYPQIVDSLGTQSAVEHAEGLLRPGARRHHLGARRNHQCRRRRWCRTRRGHDSMTASLQLLPEHKETELFSLVDRLHPSGESRPRHRIYDVSAHQRTFPILLPAL